MRGRPAHLSQGPQRVRAGAARAVRTRLAVAGARRQPWGRRAVGGRGRRRRSAGRTVRLWGGSRMGRDFRAPLHVRAAALATHEGVEPRFRESAGAPASPPHAAWSPHGRRGAPCAPPGPVTRAARAGAAGSRCSRFQEPTAGGWTEARPGGRRCAGRGPRALPAVPGGPVPGQRPRRTPQDEAGQTASSGDLRRSLCGWVCESPAGAFLRTHRARFLGQHFWVVLLCPRPAGSSARGRAREG